MGILLRWLGAFVLLSATFNPSRWNYLAWVRGAWADQMPLALFLGLVLAVGYMVYGVATLRSIGPFGVVLVVAIAGSALWVLADWGWLSLANPSLNLWLGGYRGASCASGCRGRPRSMRWTNDPVPDPWHQ